MIKKIKYRVLTFFMCFVFLTCNTSVLAQELINDTSNIQQTRNAQNVIVKKFPQMFNLGGHLPQPFANKKWNFEHIYNVDTSAPLYCVEFGVMANQGPFVHTETLQWGSFSDYQKDLLKDVLLYGFNGTVRYGFSWDVEYKATQIMVWIISTNFYNTPQENAIVSEFSKNNGNIHNAYNAIKNKMNSHNNIPVFSDIDRANAPLYTMTHMGDGIHEIILTDTNNVISQFKFSFPPGVTSQMISHNQMLIRSTVPLNGGSLMTFTKVETINAPNLVFLVKQGEQTKMAPKGITDPVRSYFHLQTKALGNLTINKTSENGKKSGFQFNIKGLDPNNNHYNKNHTTNSQGQIIINNLDTGNYQISEINVPSEYITPSSQTITVTDYSTKTVNFLNNLKKGNLNIVKSSEDNIVNGFEFRVRGLDTNNNNYNKIHRTNANGQIAINNIIQGRYEISEINTPVRYNQPQSQIVNVTYNSTATVRFNNVLKKGKLEITKTDQDSKALIDGVEFSIYSKRNNQLIQTITTNQNGIALSRDLVYGDYYFKETKHKYGYIPNPKIYDFSIVNDKQVVRISITNKKQYGKITLFSYGQDIDDFDFFQTDVGKIYSPVYREVKLRESTFSLYAKQDIIGADKIKYFNKDDLVKILKVQDGETFIDNLILGEYYVKQDTVDTGHFIGNNYAEFNLIYDETKDIIEDEKEFRNVLQKINVDITLEEDIPTNVNFSNTRDKVISSDITQAEDGKLNSKIEKELKYGIYSKQDVKDRDNNVILEKGNLIELVTFNNRKAKINTNLPFGLYNLKSISLADNIVESQELKDISFTPQPSNVLEVFEKRQQSYIMPTKQIEILKKAKYSEDILEQGYEEEVLEDAEFEIYKVYSDGNKLIETLVTDEDGKALSTSLTYGEYLLRETKAPFGYLPLEEDIPFTIDNNTPLILEKLIENYPRIGYATFDLKIPKRSDTSIKQAHKVNDKSQTEVIEPTRITYEVSPPTGDSVVVKIPLIFLLLSIIIMLIVYLRKEFIK